MRPRTGKVGSTGRSTATPIDGSCGPASLLEALKHLARTRQYQFAIPENADDLRAAIVQDIRENLSVGGSSQEMPTLEQEIAAEYWPGDLKEEERRGIFCPELDDTRYIL